MASAAEFLGLDELHRSAYASICLDQLQYRIVLCPLTHPPPLTPGSFLFSAARLIAPIEFHFLYRFDLSLPSNASHSLTLVAGYF